MENSEKLIEVTNLKKYFPIKKNHPLEKSKFLKAVDNVNFSIHKGETLGVVGESGSGKSTLGRCVANIYPVTEGKIIYKNIDITNSSKNELKLFRSKIQAIFQYPYSSLNPKLNFFDIVSEPLKI